jgi:hypothetical protein
LVEKVHVTGAGIRLPAVSLARTDTVYVVRSVRFAVGVNRAVEVVVS